MKEKLLSQIKSYNLIKICQAKQLYYCFSKYTSEINFVKSILNHDYITKLLTTVFVSKSKYGKV